VEREVFFIKGVPHHRRAFYKSYIPIYDLYVHPETGILCKAKPRPKYVHVDKEAWKTVKVSDTISLKWIDGQWYECTLAPALKDKVRYEVVDGVAVMHYIHRKGDLVQVSKKQLSKKEKKRHGIGVARDVRRPHGRRPQGGERRPYFLR
jgi:hypothetical protein